jgi:hypothetical protein
MCIYGPKEIILIIVFKCNSGSKVNYCSKENAERELRGTRYDYGPRQEAIVSVYTDQY